MDVGEIYEAYVRHLPLGERLRLAERIVAQAAAEATGNAPAVSALEPLGSRLRAIRARIEQAGEPLLDAEAMRKELTARRGGTDAWEQSGDATEGC